MEEDSTPGKMARNTMETGITIRFMAVVHISGSMVESTPVNGSTTICTDTVYTLGKMVGVTKASTLRTESMDMASISGQMAANMMDSGKMAGSTAKVHTGSRRAKIPGEVFGLKASVTVGLTLR